MDGVIAATEADPQSPPRDGGATWFGHPRGLAFLAMTEAWERFSFYGMRGLLVLYLVQELLLPGHIEQVAGMMAFRRQLEGVFGPMSTQAFASQIFGFYSGLVYLTPLFGGWIADRWLGATRTVLIGIALMTAGHFAMAFERSVLLALLLLVLGSGCLKGNIAAQVGMLYPRHDEARRSRGYVIFGSGINLGAMLGPFVCGLLAQLYGWHVGFGAAGIMMVLAGIVYLRGLRHFAARPAGHAHRTAVRLSGPDRKLVGIIALVIFIGAFQSLAYDQMYNVGFVWVDARVDLSTPLGTIPTPWFASLDSLTEILIVPVLIVLWAALARLGREPDDLGKIAVGAALQAAGCLTLALAEVLAGPGKAGLWAPVLSYFLAGVAFIWSWPVTLAFVSRHAPPSIAAVAMAAAYLQAFLSGFGVGVIGAWYEALGAAPFWLLVAGLSFTSTLLVLLLGPAIRRTLARLEAQRAR